MDLQEASSRLNTTFITGGFNQITALRYLTMTVNADAIDILVDAHEKDIQQQKIFEILKAERIPAKVNRLWRLWMERRSAKLDAIVTANGTPSDDESLKLLSLLKLGMNNNIPKDVVTIRKVFHSLELKDQDIISAVLAFAKELSASEETADALYEVWMKNNDPRFADVIRSKQYKPSNPSVECLFYLINNQLDRYFEIENPHGDLFKEAFILASEPFRAHLNQIVVNSRDQRLANAYSKALRGRREFNSAVLIKGQLAIGDDTGLFESAKHLTLSGLLEFCDRWSTNGWRPDNLHQAAHIERALAAYSTIRNFEITSTQLLPPGKSNFFAWCRRQNI